jgi:hypothetical protein
LIYENNNNNNGKQFLINWSFWIGTASHTTSSKPPHHTSNSRIINKFMHALLFAVCMMLRGCPGGSRRRAE